MNSSFLYQAWGLYGLECTKEQYKGNNNNILHIQSKKRLSVCGIQNHQEPFRPFGSISCPNAYQVECQPEAGIARRTYQGRVEEWQYAAGGCYRCCGESGV